MAYKMTSSIKKYVYAMNAYGTAIYQPEVVKWSILNKIPEARQNDIINNEKYGLKSVSSVSVWMEAIELGSNSLPYKTLMREHKLTE